MPVIPPARAVGAAARRAAALATRAARHAAWYVRYQVDGTPRNAPSRKRSRSRR